ncbi:hypothetical protein ACIQ4Z_10325 [Peribacillus asahii]|uniref:hypothetical protein n=1 Tax=Peribacillus asahii TaxID=228899 RepID=UPI00382958FE
MELIMMDQSIQFEKQPSVEDVIEKINELLGDNYYFSHLIVDGIAVYDDLEQYLSEEILKIEKLEIVAQTVAAFTNDILLTAEEYLTRAEPGMVTLTDGFYQNPESKQWTSFADMLEGIQWLNQIISAIDSMKDRPRNWEGYVRLAATLEVQLQTLEEAVENSDTVLIADIIQYELIPLYQALRHEIHTTIDNEGIRDDVN